MLWLSLSSTWRTFEFPAALNASAISSCCQAGKRMSLATPITKIGGRRRTVSPWIRSSGGPDPVDRGESARSSDVSGCSFFGVFGCVRLHVWVSGFGVVLDLSSFSLSARRPAAARWFCRPRSKRSMALLTYKRLFGSYVRQNFSPSWSRYVSIRKSGHRAGGLLGSALLRPNHCSHSGPERYVTVAISRASFMPAWGDTHPK